jgi:hypothetical protein
LGNVVPEQIGETSVVNVGTLGEFIEIVIVVVLAHWPGVGVKVYGVVVVLFMLEGLQVPVMLFVELVGKEFIVAPEQIGATCVNVGSVGAVTETVADPVFPEPVSPEPEPTTDKIE